MRKLVLLLAASLVYVRSQSSKGEDRCNGPPNIYYNFGSDDSMISHGKLNEKIQQGRPGKSGVQGIKGEKGVIGQKGEAGTPDDTAEELQIVKRKLQLLNNTDEEMQSFFKTQLEVVNDTTEELKTQSKLLNDTTEELHLVKTQLNDLRDLLFSHPRSCDHLNKTTNPSGTYLISPDPLNVLPFNVVCNFTRDSTETIIHHDSESEIQVSNCDPSRCYKRSIHYTASLQQIEALIQSSSQCRQFIKYRCRGSVLLIDYGSQESASAWLSRNGTAKLYWGGATSQRDRYCACGESGSCADNALKCNCDKNDNTERFDEGYLTDKADLPVRGLQFGDASANAGEKGWHTLGPLICFGR